VITRPSPRLYPTLSIQSAI